MVCSTSIKGQKGVAQNGRRALCFARQYLTNARLCCSNTGPCLPYGKLQRCSISRMRLDGSGLETFASGTRQLWTVRDLTFVLLVSLQPPDKQASECVCMMQE